MVIAKVRGGYVILHATKKGEVGKRISATKKPVSLAKARKIHIAIVMSKKRRGAKQSAKGYEKILKRKGWVKKKYWVKKRKR